MYNFNFEEDKDFFNQSATYQLIFEKVNNQDVNIDSKLLNAGVRLWAETVLKHNFHNNMITYVEPLYFITDENSELVKNKLGKVIFKDKDKRNEKDRHALLTYKNIRNNIELILLRSDVDFFATLKQEYLEFKNNNDNNNSRKITPS